LLLLFIINFTLPGVINQGDRIFYTDARSLGLGGITVVLENGDNPGSSGLVNRISLMSSGAVSSFNEKRGLRVYDSYGNNIGISTLSNNTFVDVSLATSSIIIPFKFLRIGLKHQPVWHFNYSYRYVQRDDFYQITKTIDDDYTGIIYALVPVLGFTYKFINIGIEERFFYGKNSRTYRVIFPTAPDSSISSEAQYNGSTTKIGAILVPSIHFRVSYFYTFKYTLESDNTGDFSYPDVHSFGLFYQPPGRIPTRFMCEFNYENWNEPLFIYRFGVEHTILNSYALRYGFCLFPDYKQTAVWSTILTFGMGMKTDRFFIDLGFGYGKRDYLHSDFSGLDVGDYNLKFDETSGHFVFSSGITF